jgi:hypothetical protein
MQDRRSFLKRVAGLAAAAAAAIIPSAREEKKPAPVSEPPGGLIDAKGVGDWLTTTPYPCHIDYPVIPACGIQVPHRVNIYDVTVGGMPVELDLDYCEKLGIELRSAQA